jgi:hypothetical protein
MPVLFYKFVRGVHEGKILDDLEFELLERNHDGDIVAVKYKGCWFLVDNGYLRWATTVPLMKLSYNQKEIRFSEWLELIQKDVKCTFGILKGRWRILKSGIRLHGTKPAEAIFKTCCALHNCLLEGDGLDEG